MAARPPNAALVLSLAGGVIALISGIGLDLFFIFPVPQLLLWPGLGLLIIIAALVARADPRRHVLWGAIIIASSGVSSLELSLWLYYLPTLGVFLLAGVVLGILGGVGWIRWKAGLSPRWEAHDDN